MINMKENLITKAKNYYIIGLFAQEKHMYSEAVSNFFKAIFALADAKIYQLTGQTAKDHGDRFSLLKSHDAFLYDNLDGIFFMYRETYTKDVTLERVKVVRRKTDEVFNHLNVTIPTEEDL